MKLGFIGMGNMASAILIGALQKGCLSGNDVWAYNPTQKKVDPFVDGYGVNRAASNSEVCQNADIIILGVKPYKMAEVMKEISAYTNEKAMVSIASGWRRAEMAAAGCKRSLSIIPNTPVQVGEGISIFEDIHTLMEEEYAYVAGLFSAIGMVHTLPTTLMGIGATLCGCGPAFTFIFIEALADAAVANGLPRPEAYGLAAQMVLGSGKMVLETGTHPGQLKDNVCSPGGTTIKGVIALEEKGFRAAAIDAIRKSAGG
ncbi:pyrroline-5-carboxylate reductase [Eubacteriales bacterium OttesenSCG-928-M02]|nr:pyrroline-5-carboxylate reductase [Eubacteriales bacterium OttesenSCG-928-M02]